MDDQDRPHSYQQDVWMRVLEICSVSLSVIGSTTIVSKVLRDRAQNNGSMTPYDRIMMGLSSCDILSSITWVIDDLFQPSESGRVWALGNQATCQAGGFLIQCSLSSWWYNCMLSFYFLLTVLSQVRRKNFVRKYEFWMHLSVVFFPITAIVGLLRGWYTEEAGCWIEDPVIVWIFAGGPVFFTYFSLIINNIVIFALLRKSLKSSENAVNLTVKQKRLKREVGTLMFLYVTFFFVAVSPRVAITIKGIYFRGDDDSNGGKWYPLFLVDAILKPLQGFFNFFIYIKPMYTRFRPAYPNKSKWFVLRQAVLNSKAPRLNHRRIANHHTHHSDVLITDITLGEDGVMDDPNQALFYPGELPSSSNPSSNDIAEGDNERVSDDPEESKEED